MQRTLNSAFRQSKIQIIMSILSNRGCQENITFVTKAFEFLQIYSSTDQMTNHHSGLCSIKNSSNPLPTLHLRSGPQDFLSRVECRKWIVNLEIKKVISREKQKLHPVHLDAHDRPSLTCTNHPL